MKETDDAVLSTLEDDVLRPEVVRASLNEALARLTSFPTAREADLHRLRSTLGRLKVELGRLTAALVSGGELPTIVAAIKERETQQGHVELELTRLSEEPNEVRHIDLSRVEHILRVKLTD